MQSPVVSVIMPAYNHERYVGEAIRSVLNQTYADFEFIIINDGSTDKTGEIIQSFEDPRIRYYQQENADAFNVINRGFSLAEGKYISIINSDDVYHPDRLAFLVDAIEKEKAFFLITNLILIDDNSEIIEDPSHPTLSWFNELLDTYVSTKSLEHTFLGGNIAISTSNFFFLSSVPREIGLLKPYRYGHDYDYALRALARYRDKFVFAADKAYLYYRVHSKNTIAESPRETNRQVFNILLDNIADMMVCDEDNARMTAAANALREIHIQGIKELFRTIGEQPQLLDEQTRMIGEQLFTIDAQFRTIGEQFQDLDKQARTIREQSRTMDEQARTVAKQARLLEEQEKRLQAMSMSKSWRLTAPLRKIAHLFSDNESARTAGTRTEGQRSLIRKSERFLRSVFRPDGEKADIPGPDHCVYHVKMPVQNNAHRPRVVHALANFMTGGSSRLVIDLIEHLGHVYEQLIVTSYVPDPPAYVGATVHEFPNTVSSQEILAYFRRFKPEIIHIHYWGDCDYGWYDKVFQAAEKTGCKIIENINTPVKPYISQAVSQYVYVSNYVYETFGSPDKNSSVIYPGSNFDLFVRRNDRISDNCIGMVYRLETDKLDEKAIDVFIKVVRRRPGTKVLIVGGGTFLEVYRQAVDRAGVMASFEFTGYVPYDRLPQYYEQMSIFVAPVWNESFGQVSSFAMNMGIPVAGYNVGALYEILGNAELLAPPGDSDCLVEIIIDLLDNREKRLAIGKINRERAQSSFSVESMVGRYALIYKDLLTKGSSK